MLRADSLKSAFLTAYGLLFRSPKPASELRRGQPSIPTEIESPHTSAPRELAGSAV